MVKVGELVDRADLLQESKATVKTALAEFGYPDHDEVGKAFLRLDSNQLKVAGLNPREINAIMAEIELLRPAPGPGPGSSPFTPWDDVGQCPLLSAPVKAAVGYIKVPCEVTSVDDLLGTQSFREDLRYLQLLSDRSMDLAPAIKTLIGVRMKRKREYWKGVNRGEILSIPDLEVPYHPIVVELFKAASKGQEGLAFTGEEHASCDSSREDVRGFVLDSHGNWHRAAPSEVKVQHFSAKPGNPISGIHANSAGFGMARLRHTTSPAEVYKCMKVHALKHRTSPALALGALVSRCHYMWFVEILWEQDADSHWAAKRCRVAPTVREKEVVPDGELVFRMDWEELSEEMARRSLTAFSFREFMLWATNNSVEPPKGFRYLSRFSDRLAAIHGLLTARLQLRREGQQEPVDLSNAAIVGRGARSMVLRLSPDADYVVKISASRSIERERQMHAVIDPHGCQHLRPAVRGGCGIVDGAGDGLSFIELQHFCKRGLSMSDLTTDEGATDFMSQATVALSVIHSAGVLHRDIKPDNVLLLKPGCLIINDFDVACFQSSTSDRKGAGVGAPALQSPRLDADSRRSFERRDDWASLGLTFAYLLNLYDLQDHAKKYSLQRLLQLPAVPEAFKEGLKLALRD